LVVGLALAAGVAGAQSVQQKAEVGEGKGTVSQMVEMTAVVKSVDLKTREVVLTGEGNRETTVVAGPDVQRLDEVKVGDQVRIKYYESLTLKLDQVPGGQASQSEKVGEVRSEPGDMPGGIRTREVTLTAKITAVDAKASTVTLIGPKGRSVDLEVAADTLKKVKVGDLVSATYTEALAVELSRVTVK
jgi:hypothetical protein